MKQFLKILKTIFLGLVLWFSVLFLATLLRTIGINNSLIIWLIIWLVIAGLSWYFSLFCQVKTWQQGIIIGLIWVAVAFIFDYLITLPYDNLIGIKLWDIIRQSDFLVVYILTLAMPTIYGLLGKPAKNQKIS
jgi:hypothetical protein